MMQQCWKGRKFAGSCGCGEGKVYGAASFLRQEPLLEL